MEPLGPVGAVGSLGMKCDGRSFLVEVDSLPKTEGGDLEREFVKTVTLHVARRVLFLSLQNLHVLVGLNPTAHAHYEPDSDGLAPKRPST